MGRKRENKKAFVPVRIRRSDGIIQVINIRGRKRALQHPLRVNKNGKYINHGPFHAARFLPSRNQQRAPPTANAPTAREPRVVAPGAPAPARKAGRTGAVYSTWFKALGTVGNRNELRGTDSPDLLGEDMDDFAAPAAFYSNQGGLLGKVKFAGIVPLADLVDRLNLKLQFRGEERSDFDFRDAYTSWEYRYQVVETLGPTDRIIDEQRDSRG